MIIIEKIKTLVKMDSGEDMIHLRAIKYGMKFPNGCMYKNFEDHYGRRPNDWKIVSEFFREAYNNYSICITRKDGESKR